MCITTVAVWWKPNLKLNLCTAYGACYGGAVPNPNRRKNPVPPELALKRQKNAKAKARKYEYEEMFIEHPDLNSIKSKVGTHRLKG